MIYTIIFKKSAFKDLMKLSSEEVQTIIVRIDNLGLNPRPKGSKKL